MPDARCQRFQDELGLSEYDANLLTLEKQTADYFETVVKEGVDAKEAANWMLGEFARSSTKKASASPILLSLRRLWQAS